MLNKQGKGKIDWTDYTWNPITGCKRDCDYCYVKRWVNRFNYSMEPEFHERRLNDLSVLQSPAKIFVSSTGDMWGPWVSAEWIDQVLDVVRKYPQHTFQFLTKYPKRYLEFDLPYGWYGATIDGTCKTNSCDEFIEKLRRRNKDIVTFFSFEPMLHYPTVSLWHVDWIIIGADSNKGAKKPRPWWAGQVIDRARKNNVDVWIKDNLKYGGVVKVFPKDKRIVSPSLSK